MKLQHIDYPFLFVVILLTLVGFVIFSSAALGLLARDGASFSSVASNQVLFGIVCGGIGMWVLSRLDYRLLRRFSIPFFIFAILLTCLTFVPGIGLTLKGASRWIEVGGFTFQPVELLKLATITFLASYYATNHKKADSLVHGLLPFIGIVSLAALPLIFQPDNDGILILAIAGASIFFAAGGRFLHLGALALVGIVMGTILIFARPYLMDRIMTFVDPSRDPQGSGYQVQQSLIAIGSGELFGRGFGQSIQKFSHLPEPVGDSVFAVAGEEFGFVGALFLVLLFLAFTAAGLRIAARSQDRFGGLLVLGIVILIATQAFVNIASLLGLFPLSGLPLTFVSHGGTALLVALTEAGIILSVSRRIKEVK